MNQILLLTGIFVFGLLFGMLFKRQLPIELLCATSFLWGSLYWIVSAIFLLSFSIPYTFSNILISFGLGLTLILYFLIRRQLWQLGKDEMLWPLASLLVFFIVLAAAENWNYSVGSLDSVSKILYGKSFAYDGITALNQGAFGSMGAFTILFQSISVFLHTDYMYLMEPAFFLSFLMMFLALGKQILSKVTKNWLMVTVLFLGLFTSTYFIRFQTFYIHDNFIAGTYLAVSLASYWLMIKEENPTWLVLGMLGLAGFSLTRIEAPLFAVAFLVLLLSTQKVKSRQRLFAMIPFLAFNTFWYFRLLFTVDREGRFLKIDNVLIIIALLLGFALYLILSSKMEWVEKYITPTLHWFMIITMGLALTFFIVLDPAHTLTNIYRIAGNVYIYGLWGTTGYVLTFLLLFLPVPSSKQVEDRIFTWGLAVFLMLTVLIGGLRGTYRLAWSDSANRMMVHIVPAIFVYLMVKYRNISEVSTIQLNALAQKSSFQAIVLAVATLVIASLIFTSYTLFAKFGVCRTHNPEYAAQ